MRAFVLSFFLVLSVVLCAGSASRAVAGPVELTDVTGRKLRLELPARRVLLMLHFEDYYAVGGDEAMKRVVGFSKAAWRDWRPANWRAYLKVRPEFDAIPDVGELEVSSFSVEKAMALKPDLVIMAEWQAKALGSDFDRIKDAGIAIAVLDYYAQDPDKHVASTLLIGRLVGAEDRAREIADEYRRAVDEVRRRVAAAGRPQPLVYVELGDKGPGEPGPSYGDYMWGSIAAVAGGRNLGRGLVRSWGPIAPEQVLAARPDVIVMSGSEWRQHATGQLMGEGISEAEARERLAGFLKRPGWAGLPAVRNGRVHAVHHGISRTIADYVSVQHFAKVLYPDLFQDIDPQANYLAFYERYLPIRPQGTFFLTAR